MSGLKNIAWFLVLSFFAHFMANVVATMGNNGIMESHDLTFDRLAADGPCGNAFVSIERCVPGEASHFYTDDGGCTFIPLFRDDQDLQTATEIVVVARIPQLLDRQQIEDVSNGIRNNENIRGMVNDRLAHSGHIDAIADVYPDRRMESAFIFDVKSRPSIVAHYVSLLLRGIGGLIAIIGVFWFCRTVHFPTSLIGQVVQIAVGTSVAAVFIWLRVTRGIESLIDLPPTAYCVLAGIGIGCVLSGFAAMVMTDRFFQANRIQNPEISFENETVTLRKRGRSRQWAFADIDAVNFLYDVDRQHVNNRRPQYKLTVSAKGETIEVLGYLEGEQGPYLQAHANQLMNHLKKRMIKQLLEGQEVACGEWKINSDRLSIHSKKDRYELPLAQISAVQQVGSEYQIWVVGQLEKAAKYSVRLANAEVLEKVLSFFAEMNVSARGFEADFPQLDATSHAEPSDLFQNATFARSNAVAGNRPVQRSASEIPSSLGRIIFEDTHTHLSGWVVVLTSFVIGAAIWFGLSPLIGGVIGGVGVIVGLIACVTTSGGRRSLRIHERGVSYQDKRSTTAIAYEDVEFFTYKVTHLYHQGRYLGDTYKFELTSTSSAGTEESIQYQSAAVETTEYEKMKVQAMEYCGKRLAAELAEREEVEWIAGCFIFKDSIEVPVRSGLSKSTERVTWDRIDLFDLTADRLLITIDGAKSATIKLDIAAPNFYPGFYLFEKLAQVYRRSAVSKSVPQEVAASN